MSRNTATVVQSIGGLILTIISIIQGLVLLPFYFKYIDFATFGYWLTISSIVALLGIINFGIGNMVIQRISSSYANNNYQKVVNYFFNSLILYLIIVTVLLTVGFILSHWLKNILNIQGSDVELYTNIFFIVLITSSFTIISNALKSFSQAILKPLFSVSSTIVSRIFGILLIVLLLINEHGLYSIVIGLLVTEIMIFLSNAFYVYVQYKNFNQYTKVDREILKEYIKHSPHLFGLMIGNMFSEQSHPIIITTLLGPEITTAYTVTRKAADLILKMLSVFNSALIGPFSHLVAEGNKEKIKLTSIKIISLSFLSALIAVGTYIATNDIFVTLWIDKELVLSRPIIILIGLGTLAYSMTRLFRSQLFGLNEFKFASNIVLLEGVLFLIISTILIKLYDIIGIAIALFLVSTFIAVILAKKIVQILDIKVKFYHVIKQFFMMIIIIIFIVFIFFNEKEYSWLAFGEYFILSIIIITIIEFAINFKYLRAIKFKIRK